MKFFNKYLFWLVSFILIAANVYIFIHSISLSDKINFYETGISSLHKKNLKLENKIYNVDSLQFAASQASELNFVKEAQPIYLDNLKYAQGQ